MCCERSTNSSLSSQRTCWVTVVTPANRVPPNVARMFLHGLPVLLLSSSGASGEESLPALTPSKTRPTPLTLAPVPLFSGDRAESDLEER